MAQSRGRPKSTLAGRIEEAKVPKDWEERMYALASEGASDIEIRVMLDISDDLWYRWIDEEPEFSRAVKRAKALCQIWWERQGRSMATGESQGNVTSWIFNMKNRFKWTDRVEQDLKSSDGTFAPVAIEIYGVDADGNRIEE